MSVRVHKLKDEGVSILWYDLAMNESVPLIPMRWDGKSQVLFVLNGQCRFNSPTSSMIVTREEGLQTTPTLQGTIVTALEGPATVVCFGSDNPRHAILKPHLWDLKANESMGVQVKGYATIAEGDAFFNDRAIGVKQILKLRGNPITVKARDTGCVVCVIELRG